MKPALDDRLYRYIKLANGIGAVLVSDPALEKVVSRRLFVGS